MLDYGNFKTNLNKVLDNPESLSRDELFDAFVDMTERYLNEMVSTLNYERALINELGEEEGSQVIEQIATSNLAVRSLDESNSEEIDPRERINNLLSYIECEFRSDI